MTPQSLGYNEWGMLLAWETSHVPERERERDCDLYNYMYFNIGREICTPHAVCVLVCTQLPDKADMVHDCIVQVHDCIVQVQSVSKNFRPSNLID